MALWTRALRFYPHIPDPSTEITEFAAKDRSRHIEWAPNEKVAAETAVGAAIGGARAMCCMKHVGLNVAADPIFTAAYTGVRAGLCHRGGGRPRHALLPERAGQPLLRHERAHSHA